MMEGAGASVIEVIQALSQAGLGVLVFVVWFWDNKERQKKDEEIASLIRELKDARGPGGKEYAELAEKVVTIASDLKDVIMLNTQSNTTIISKIDTNWFCPLVRDKAGKGNSNGSHA